MKTGDTITVYIGSGDVRRLVLDDLVLPDRTCGQVERGWWAFDPSDGIEDGNEFFISETGEVYGPALDGSCTRLVGSTLKRTPEYERVVSGFYDDTDGDNTHTGE